MDPIQSGMFVHQPTVAGPSLPASEPKPLYPHPGRLTPSLMSRSAWSTLEQIESKPEVKDRLKALKAYNAIHEQDMECRSVEGAHAYYGTWVEMPNREGERVSVELKIHLEMVNANPDPDAVPLYDIVNLYYDPDPDHTPLLPPLPPTADNVPNQMARLQYPPNQWEQALISHNNTQDVHGTHRQFANATRSKPSATSSPLTSSLNQGMSRSALRDRQMVTDPKTGERVSRSALRQRQIVTDPETGERVSISALRQRQKVTDPETGERVSRSALRQRQMVMDPKTGEMVSRSALSKRTQRRKTATGQTVSK